MLCFQMQIKGAQNNLALNWIETKNSAVTADM